MSAHLHPGSRLSCSLSRPPRTPEAHAHVTTPERVDTIFGRDIFSRTVMHQRLPKEVYRSLLRTIDHGEPLEIPAKIASSRASRRAVAMASSLLTRITSS